MQQHCIESFDAMNCRAAISFCEDYIPFIPLAVRNPYDLSKECLGTGVTCYLEADAIEDYLNSEPIRKALGLTYDVFPRNYSTVSFSVNKAFEERMDLWATPTQYHVAELLERGVRVLIYAGTYDSVCGWTANKMWVEKLAWRRGDEFSRQPWKTWEIDGREVGDVKSTGLLSLVSVWGAGHMAPHDKPVEASTLIKRWIAEDSI